MSADNYVVVRKFHDGWRYAEATMSECSPSELVNSRFARSRLFPSSEEAMQHAERVYPLLEYGIFVDDSLSVNQESDSDSDPIEWLDGEFGFDWYDDRVIVRSIGPLKIIYHPWLRCWSINSFTLKQPMTRSDIRRLCELFGVDVAAN